MATREVDILQSCIDDFPSLRAKWVVMQHSKKGQSAYDELPFVPDYDFLDPSSAVDGTIMVDPYWKGKVEKPGACQAALEAAAKQQGVDLTDRDDLKDGELDCINIPLPGLETAAGNPVIFKDDEMESWLQYPLDDSLEPDFATEEWQDIAPPVQSERHQSQHNQPQQMSQHPKSQATGPQVQQHQQQPQQHQQQNSKPPPVQPHPALASYAQGPTSAARSQTEASNNGKPSQGNNAHNPKSASTVAVAALTAGAQRAAGLMPSGNREKFSKIRTSSGNVLNDISLPGPRRTQSLKGTGPHLMEGNGKPQVTLLERVRQHQQQQQQQLLLQQQQQQQLQDSQDSRHASHMEHQGNPGADSDAAAMQDHAQHNGTLNFSHFSRPAHLYGRGTLKTLGSGVPATNRQVKQPGVAKKLPVLSSTSSVAESGLINHWGSAGYPPLMMMSSAGHVRMPGGMSPEHQGSVGHQVEKEKSCVMAKEEKAMEGSQDQGRTSTVSNGMVQHNTGGNRVHLEREVTVTSSMQTSTQSGDVVRCRMEAERSKEATKGAKRARDDEVTEGGEFGDMPEESLDTKKMGSRKGACAVDSSAAKRARAAEVHNQSERRRRDRINERMKTLQELIPNSNKTDKASMLDEAIEYLKMLQLQIQVMSMRTGISVPPGLTPGASHPNMAMLAGANPQMSAALNGMNMGAGMSGMGAMGAAGLAQMNLSSLANMAGMNGLQSYGSTNSMGMPGSMGTLSDLSMQQQQQQQMLMEMACAGGLDLSQGDLMLDPSSMSMGRQNFALLNQLHNLTDEQTMTPPMRKSMMGGRMGMASSHDHASSLLSASQAPSMSNCSFDNHRQPNPSAVDPMDAFMARQQQMQVQQQQSLNLDLYQTYLLQQRQQFKMDC